MFNFDGRRMDILISKLKTLFITLISFQNICAITLDNNVIRFKHDVYLVPVDNV